MTETYFQSLQRENRAYALEVETLKQQVSRLEDLIGEKSNQLIGKEALVKQVRNLNGLLEEKYKIIADLRGDLMAEEHKVNALLTGKSEYLVESTHNGGRE